LLIGLALASNNKYWVKSHGSYFIKYFNILSAHCADNILQL